jgi:anthranilate phosphoribosyltransferase
MQNQAWIFNSNMTADLLHAVVDGRSLTEEQAESAMGFLLAGQSTPVLTAAFLTALRMKGETVEELAGFARAMRAVATPLPIGADSRPVLDTCGTGGNGTTTFNISTVCAFVVAGAGVRVAKHGNRSITSRCGSADVLEALGVRTQAGPEAVARAVRDVGIGFLFAPAFHSAVRHVQPVRLELKFRTAFNYLGPLTNPARAEMQVSGTWSDSAAEKIAGAMAKLGLERGYVVHGSDGLGEVTITGPWRHSHANNGDPGGFRARGSIGRVPAGWGRRTEPDHGGIYPRGGSRCAARYRAAEFSTRFDGRGEGGRLQGRSRAGGGIDRLRGCEAEAYRTA